jgi:hypothetical protein
MRRKIISNQLEQIKRFNQNVCCFMTARQENFSADPLADLLYDVPAHGSSHFQNNEISIGQRVENKHSAPLWKYFARPEAKLTTPIEFTFQWCACRQLWVRAAPIFFCWLSIAIRPQ